jgi:hypothetical protein
VANERRSNEVGVLVKALDMIEKVGRRLVDVCKQLGSVLT